MNCFLHNEGESSPLKSHIVRESEALPGPPHGASAAAVLHQRGGPEAGAADSLGLMGLLLFLLLLLEALQGSDTCLRAGSFREEVHGVPPAVRVALAVVAVTEALLQLLLQEAHRHLQDVGFLQLGVGLLLVELLLQDDLELIDAAVDAISAHFLHDRFSQLVKVETGRVSSNSGASRRLYCRG